MVPPPETASNLQALFAPGSIAVVGASRAKEKLGYLVLRNVKTSGFPGPIYPVNPRARQILGLRAYPSVTAIPDAVDLAIIVVPRPAVLPVIEDCAVKRVRAAIIMTAGFRETGPAGAALEQAIVQVARRVGMRILGPNCLGAIDTVTPLNASFASRMPEPNGIAFLSQSGALGTAILDWAAGRHLGFSKFVSLGNEADVTESDILSVWENDESVRVIAGYLEGVPDGGRFRATASRVTRRRPVVVLKGGRTAAGSQAVASHTGALAGSDLAYSAAFRQTGVIRVDTLEALFDAALAFSAQPRPAGRRLIIVTNAGGPAIVATDAASLHHLTLAPLAASTVQALKSQLPPSASTANPIDVLGDAGTDRYRLAIDLALADPNGDALLVILTPQLRTDVVGTARAVVEAAGHANRPVLASFMGSVGVRAGLEILTAGGVPNYPFPERAVAALAAMADEEEARRRPTSPPRRFPVDREKVDRLIAHARAIAGPNVDSYDAAQIVAAYGVPVPPGVLAKSPDEAAQGATRIGFPVVLKVVSPDILHKSEVGGVRLNLKTPEEVRQAYLSILASVQRAAPGARILGIAVWAMAAPGIETIVGLSIDPTFGHLVLFGLGGIYVEVLRDVSFRIAPITPEDARAMIQEIRAYPILAGARGQPPADVAALAAIVERISQLATDHPEIRELDVNPLIVYSAGRGALAVDVRMTLSV